ncbi:MAG: superoxide dismutase [Chloroflexi bacterium]|nr:superoxide dismutase [Chloroflexota bacterium]
MDTSKMYELPRLPYGYGDLAPYISEEQLRIHHTKHHQAYVNGANAIIERFDKARKDGVDLDMKATLKELSFQLGGHELHSTFWQNLAPAGNGGGGQPTGMLRDAMMREYGSFERFRKEFTQAAVSVEGSGWAVLTYCEVSHRIGVMQVEKHNVNFPVGSPLLMALDVWEHAYYLDYKNDRAKFVEAFWNIVNWDIVDKMFAQLLESRKPVLVRA